MSAARPRAFALCARFAIAALGLAACTEDSTTSYDDLITTAIAVDPQVFLGDVPCSAQPGALQSYVATITDVTEPTAPFTLPSSGPLPCSVTALFRYIVLGHVYTAQVDAYDVAAETLAPFGGSSSGSRVMLDASGVAATPRWTTECSEPALAQEFSEAVVGACAPLEDSGAEGPTVIRVDPTRTLGALDCETVPSFDIHPDDASLPGVVGLGCGAGGVDFGEEIVAGTTYSFGVTASLGAAPLAARCFATAVAGRTVTATCDALTSKGSLAVAFADVVPPAGPTCGDGADTFEVQAFPLSGSGTYLSGTVSCLDEVRFTALEPGLYGAKVIARSADGATVWTALCGASVAPGALGYCTD